MDQKVEIKLCMILKFSILSKLSKLTYMHNLKTNFDKILVITKSTLSHLLLPDGNFQSYRHTPKMSYIEVVTSAITAESLGIDSENLLFSKLKKEFTSDFLTLTDRSNYNRRRKRLQDYVAWVTEPVAGIITPDNKQFIVDSIPIPICQNPRISRSKICRDDPDILPQRGYHASHKTHYFGFKMQLVLSKTGVPVSLGLTPANIHDVRYLQDLDKNKLHDSELIADKEYLSAGYQASLFQEDRIRLITPLRANMKRRESPWNPAYRYTSKRIETLFSQLCDQLFLKRNYAKTLDGLFARMCTKISSVAVLQYINFLNNKPIRGYVD